MNQMQRHLRPSWRNSRGRTKLRVDSSFYWTHCSPWQASILFSSCLRKVSSRNVRTQRCALPDQVHTLHLASTLQCNSGLILGPRHHVLVLTQTAPCLPPNRLRRSLRSHWDHETLPQTSWHQKGQSHRYQQNTRERGSQACSILSW